MKEISSFQTGELLSVITDVSPYDAKELDAMSGSRFKNQ